MNILYLDATRSLYGASKMLLLLIEQTASLGVRPYVVLANDVEDDMRLSRELARRRVTYWEYPVTVLRRQKYLNVRGALYLSGTLLRSVPFLRRLIRKYRIDLVQTNTSTILPGAIAARMERVPHIWHVHELFRKLEGRVLAPVVSRLSSGVVVPSLASARNLVAAHPPIRRKLNVIKNGIDPTPYRTVPPEQVALLRAEWKIPPAAKVVGMIGRIGIWKGEDQFVEMAARLTKGGIDAHYVIVGGVFDESKHHLAALQDLISQKGLADRIVVAGLREDVPSILHLLDVLVHLPSRPEPFGLVAVEAMAAAKPVVAAAIGGLAEIVDNGRTGFLVQPGSVEDAAVKVARLLRSEVLATSMGKAGSERLDANFLANHYAAQFGRLYRRVVPS